MNSIRLAIFWGTLAWAETGDVDTSSCNISLPWTVSKTDYSDVSDTVFASLFQCPGDLNGCGDRTLLTCQEATYVRTCSCASNCRVYRDCCWETGIDKAEADFPESSCVVVDLYKSVRKFLYMVTGCLPSWPNDDVREACEKPGHFNETFYQIPVTSSSDMTYNLSIFCLFLKVVVFSIYKDARSFSSKCTLCLSITLLMTQLVFLLVNSFKVSRAVCTASAMLVHYGFLSTFFWTSVLSFDIWRGITAVNLSSTRKRTLALYCVVAWGAPMIIVTVAAMVNWLAPTSLVSPLYGVSSCWIGSIWAQITYFLAPMAVLLVIGIVLYLNTVFYIRKTTGHARDFEFKDGVQQSQHSHMAFPLRPRAETTPAFYKSTADLFDKLSVHVSREEILEAPASRLVERLVAADQQPPPPGAVQPYPWLALTSSTLPDHVRDFEWLKGWGVLPTKDRLFRWGVVRDAQCVNCGAIETNAHVVRDCVPARDLWRIIQRSFRDLGVDVYVTRGRCPRGAFPLLLVAICEWVLWRNRCVATAQRQRRRALWPLLWDIRKELTAYLDDQRFSLGEQEFLRRWSCRYLSVIASPVSTELEMVVMDWLGKAIELPDHFLFSTPGIHGGGVIQSTASECTLTAVLAAKTKMTTQVLQQNPSLTPCQVWDKLVVYTSCQAHSSVERAALLASVRLHVVSTDDELSVRGATLLKVIQEDRKLGFIPMAVR
ncbi:hypothetical protein HPB47_018767, partial [Ixodes persulcatus]